MKLTAILFSLLTSVMGQNILIRAPVDDTTVSPNSTFIVQVDKPNSLSPSMDVSIAIGMESCEAAGCDAVGEAQMLGNVLFTGAYSPTLKTGTGDLSQNYTVKVPASMATGQAVLTVAHFYLLGAGANPMVEVSNITVNVQ